MANPTASEIYQAERQNFVNWYSFYRRRELTAKAAVAEVIDNLKGVSVGFNSINGRLRQAVLKVRVREKDAGNNWMYTDNTSTLLHLLYGLDSRSGTFVNGKRVNGASLSAGDYVTIGPLTFLVQIDGKPEEIAPPKPAKPTAAAKKPSPPKPPSRNAADSFLEPDASDSFLAELDEL